MSSLNDSNSTSANDNAYVEIKSGDQSGYVANVNSDSELHVNANIGDSIAPRFSGGQVDAFGRLRTAQTHKLIEMAATQSADTTRYIDVDWSGGGSVTHDLQRSSIKASVTTTSGDWAGGKTRANVPYVKGSSQLVKFTGRFATPKTNLTQRYGIYDDNNGLFFEIEDTTAYVVVRSDVTGSIVNTRIAQSNWNVDKLDGTGASGKTWAKNKQTVYMIDFGWLGSHAVRFYIDIEGEIILVHVAQFANLLDYPYMRTPVLPVMAEIENTGTTASNSDMYITCVSVESEGGFSEHGKIRDFNIGTSAIAINTTEKIIAGLRIDPNSNNSSIDILSFMLLPYSGNDAAFYRIIYNPAIVGATWADADDGIAEKLTGYTSYSGGSVLKSGYFPTDNKAKIVSAIDNQIASDTHMGFAIDGTPDAMILTCRTIAGSASVFMSCQYREMT